MLHGEAGERGNGRVARVVGDGRDFGKAEEAMVAGAAYPFHFAS